MTTTTVKVVGPRDGKAGFLGSIGVRLMIEGPEAGDRFSLVYFVVEDLEGRPRPRPFGRRRGHPSRRALGSVPRLRG